MIIVFGGSGFIGYHLINYTINNISNIDLINIDLVKTVHNINNNYVKGDVRNKIDVPLNIPSDAIIYNFAAIHKIPGHENHEYFETNILGAENVCDFARNKNIRTIVFASSIAPYGASENIKYENTLPMPNTPYGISKLTAEYIHRVWQAESPYRKLIIVRPGVVFGKFESGNFTRLYKSLKKGVFLYPGRKDTLKASIYVKDLVRLIVEIVEKEKPGVRLYNMCYPEPHTIEEIVDMMSEVIDVKSPKLKIHPFILNSLSSLFQMISKITGRTIMGIHPERIKKLMISTNISGKKLIDSGYTLCYSLKEAIEDWYKDCNFKELS